MNWKLCSTTNQFFLSLPLSLKSIKKNYVKKSEDFKNDCLPGKAPYKQKNLLDSYWQVLVIHTHTHIYIHTYMYICVHIYVYTCIHVYVCIHTCIHIKDFIFREGKGGRKRGTEISMCSCLSCGPHWGPGPQPRHMPWLGIEPVTLWFAGWHSIHWATPTRAENLYLRLLFV